MSMKPEWPALPYFEWLDTHETLHRYTQVIGKIKLVLAPFLNEWWHVALHPWAQGLTTGIIPYEGRLFEIRFNFVTHELTILDSIGGAVSIKLQDRTVAEFYVLVLSKLKELNIEVQIDPKPQEMEDTTPLDKDTSHFRYDEKAVERFWDVLQRVTGVFEKFRSGFSGKASPVHFWWGSFDLGLTRFAGKLCDPPPNSGRLARVDCDEEHFSAGFWPGDTRFPEPGFYAYIYPAPNNIDKQRIRPTEAAWNPNLGEFILPFETVRRSADPQLVILDFLTSTYEVSANVGNWDRGFLERKIS